MVQLSTNQMLTLATTVINEIEKLKALRESLKADSAGNTDETFTYLSSRLEEIMALTQQIQAFVEQHQMNVTHDLWGGQYTPFMALLDQLIKCICDTDLKQISVTPESLSAINAFIETLKIANGLLPNDKMKALEQALTQSAGSTDTQTHSEATENQDDPENPLGLFMEAPDQDQPQKPENPLGLFMEDPNEDQKNTVVAEFDRIIKVFRNQVQQLTERVDGVHHIDQQVPFNDAIQASNTLLDELEKHKESFAELTGNFAEDFNQLKEGIKQTFEQFESKKAVLNTPRQSLWGAWATKLKSGLYKLLSIPFTTKTTEKFDTMKTALKDLKAPETKDSPEEKSDHASQP